MRCRLSRRILDRLISEFLWRRCLAAAPLQASASVDAGRINPDGRACDLLHRALLGYLVRPPAQQLGAMSETLTGDMVKTNLDHELGPERFPFAATVRAPAAGTA